MCVSPCPQIHKISPCFICVHVCFKRGLDPGGRSALPDNRLTVLQQCGFSPISIYKVRRISISNPAHLLRIYVSVPHEHSRQAAWQVSLLWARRDDSMSVERGEMPQVTVLCGLSGDLMTLTYPYRWTWFHSQDRSNQSHSSLIVFPEPVETQRAFPLSF